MSSQVYVIMGVSGSGKSTVGRALAEDLGCPFFDGDDFHPPENVAKMSRGIPLTDADRAPWLARLERLIAGHLAAGQSAVVACSALKERYRQQLGVDGRVRFVFLNGDFDLIWQRMSGRQDHYMKAEMLRSQFEALELPNHHAAIYADIRQDIDDIVAQIRRADDEESHC